MEESPRISTLPPELKSQDFEFLREAGLEVIQNVASQTWTDHNLHDPGITMLEALCYAMTETGLRTGMSTRDLLSSAEALAPQEFFTPREVLPSGPITLVDFQKVLMDHNLVQNAWIRPLISEPAGQYSVLLEFEDDDLNNYTFSYEVTPPALSNTYQVSLALPHWDEQEVSPLQTDVQLLNAAFDGLPWQLIEGSDAFFSRVLLDYQPPSGPAAQTALWVVAHIHTPVEDALVENPAILSEVSDIVLTLGDNSAADLTLLKQYNRRVTAANVATGSVQRYLNSYRNLSESFAEFRSVRVQEVALTASIEITTGVDAEQLLADIFLEVDQFISPQVPFQSLDNLLTDSVPEDIFEGPPLDHGFLEDEALENGQISDILYTSDILRIIYQLRGAEQSDVQSLEVVDERSIVAVHHLTLSNYLDNRIITSDARDCLQLVQSNRHVPRLSPEKCNISFSRNGVEVEYDIQRVLALFEDHKSATVTTELTGSTDLTLPDGASYAITEYYPVQNDLPFAYGVGEAGLPEQVSDTRLAQSRQLKGYLFFFEQLLAGHLSQLGGINAFFSAKEDLDVTVFQQPLYHLPQVQSVIRAFDESAGTWNDFQSDPDNAYVTALSDSSETEDQFLDRRNRTLDHLLARVGEDLSEFSGMTFRRAFEVPNAEGMSLTDLLAAQQVRRREAIRQLIHDKSSFYYDLPALNRDRAQSFGNVAWRVDNIVQIEEVAGEFHWQLLDLTGQPRVRRASASSSSALAQRDAEESLVLATTSSSYFVVPAGGGQFRFEIRVAEDQPPLAESIQTFASNAQALTGVQRMIDFIRQLWVERALMPLECRLYHLLQIPFKERRILVNPLSQYFEIFDEVDLDAIIEKRFRLWEFPGATGDELLESEGNYPGPDDATATAAAVVAVEEVISQGLISENYSLDGVSPAIQIVLNDSSGNILARSPGTFVDETVAGEEIQRIQQLISNRYGLEGFYVIEHNLLYPELPAEPSLNLQDGSSDPYSFQVTVVFPSGYARDFSTDERVPDQPARFRDEEFRRYATRVIRKACPAHILPHILWVDRAQRGIPLSGTEPCFDFFEARYRSWLGAYTVNGVADAVIAPLRTELVQTMNAIYQDVRG